MSRSAEASRDQQGRMLSPGKRRGLAATSTPNSVFSILALDHLAALSSTLRPENPGLVPASELAEVKVRLVEWLAADASGVLIDPIVGLEPVAGAGVLPPKCGLMLGLEDGDYASLTVVPRLFAGWDVARAERAGADAIKCSFLYDPYVAEPPAHEFVADLVAGCEKADLPLFAEPLSPHPVPGDRRTVVVDTARRIGSLGADVLKLEFPVDPNESSDEAEWRDACDEVTAVTPGPWTLLSGGVDFDTFTRQLAVACAAGASGYVAGRAIWGDVVAGGLADDLAAVAEAEHRLAYLTEIAVAYARPWTTWFDRQDELVMKPGESRNQ